MKVSTLMLGAIHHRREPRQLLTQLVGHDAPLAVGSLRGLLREKWC
jgi:hypothetical protein